MSENQYMYPDGRIVDLANENPQDVLDRVAELGGRGVSPPNTKAQLKEGKK